MEASLVVPTGFVLSSLFMVNIFFVRRLVIKIDDLEKAVDQRLPVQQTEIKNICKEIESVKLHIANLSHDVKDFGHIRERVAVIEALYRKPG